MKRTYRVGTFRNELFYVTGPCIWFLLCVEDAAAASRATLEKSWLPWESLTPSGKFDSLGKISIPRENLRLPREKLTPSASGKIDSLGKIRLPWEEFTLLGKVDFLGKSCHPREKLTTSRKVDSVNSLRKIWLPREKMTSSGKFDSLAKIWLSRAKLTTSGKVDNLGKSWIPRENLTPWGTRCDLCDVTRCDKVLPMWQDVTKCI